MKKGILLNSDLSRVVSLLGHTDSITLADAGLPIPSQVERIDLALVKGQPSLMATVEAIGQEMMIEKVVMASEIKLNNESIHTQLLEFISWLQQQQGNQISIEYVSHTVFKEMSKQSKAVVRTGECSPFANVHFFSGVTF